jgi:hypothetical protein
MLHAVLGAIPLGLVLAAPADLKPNPVPKQEYVWLGDLAGTVQSVGTDVLHVRVAYTVPTLNQRDLARAQGAINKNYGRALAHLRGGLLRHSSLRYMEGLQYEANIGRILLSAPYRVYRYRPVLKTLDFQTGDDIQVRSLHPPAAFDDKGNVRKYTAQELRELRGNGRLPGYKADLQDLQPGQLVEVYLYRRRHAAGEKPQESVRPIVRLVLILNEAQR